MNKIVLTGGGTAGHVTPNLAIIPGLQEQGMELHYIGRKKGIERELLESTDVIYHSIAAGKLRRYFDLKNITDLALILLGFWQSFWLLLKIRPHLIFSKGGFVSCPVVWSAWLQRVPVVIHESDLTPGLANKLSAPFATKILYSFPETARYLPPSKAILAGIPVRESLLKGNSEEGKRICAFDTAKPVIMIIGGSLGSQIVNRHIRQALKQLLKNYSICHICGKGNIEPALETTTDYCQFEYVLEELPHLFALADVIISRAGATTLFELLALKKPSLLIPLSRKASRGDQILNARSFENQKLCLVLQEDDLSTNALVNHIERLFGQKKRIEEAIAHSDLDSTRSEVFTLFKSLM